VSEQITIRKGGHDIAEIEKEMTALRDQLAAVTKERDELRRIANGFSLNVEHMLARILPPSQPPASANVALYLELGQWAVNLNAWREELQQLSQKEMDLTGEQEDA